MFKELLRKKSVNQIIKHSSENKNKLKRVLGPFNLTTIGIGAIIGAGIFVVSGQAAATYAGPAIVYSLIFSAIACAFAGLCYAEFASMIPIAGSAYTYAYATLGEFFAWIIGWDLILEYIFGASSVAVGWSGYVTSFLKDLGIIIPAHLCNAPFMYDAALGWQATGALINIPAILIVVTITTILIFGIKESANLNNFIVVVKIAVILLFILFGISHINMDNWTPFIPQNTGVFGQYGWSGILRGAGVIFFAYIGFDVVSTAAQEAKNPQKDMPVGIMGSLAVSTILYISVALVLTGIISYKQLGVADPVAVGIDAAGASLFWLRPIIKIGAIAGLSSVILVLLLGQPRIFYSMAVDGLLPKIFTKVHPKFKTPYITTMITGSIVAVIAGLLPIQILCQMVSIGTLLAFLIVCIGVLVLRYKQPKLKRPFKVPFMPFVPILGAGCVLTQMIYLPFDTWMRLVVWLIIGLVIFFAYARSHSKLKNRK